MKRTLPLVCIALLIIGCASTKTTHPNISILYRIPVLSSKLPPIRDKYDSLNKDALPAPAQTLFRRTYVLDPVLALELGKLPEFQDKIDEKEILALRRFVNLIENATPEQKANLDNLLQVGNASFRRYCAPLQAILWVVEEKEYEEKNLFLEPLELILAQSWDFTDHDRWKNFKVVADRLNSPELISFYAQRNFSYVPYGQREITAQYIFRAKKGCCQDYTAFSVYCLKRAGYDARAITVVSPTGGRRNHVVCEYEDKDGKEYILDNSCRFCTDGKGIEEKGIYTKRFPQIGVGYW